jgi:hypothetical protein
MSKRVAELVIGTLHAAVVSAPPVCSLLRFGVLNLNLLVHRPPTSHVFNTADALRDATVETNRTRNRQSSGQPRQ